VLHKDATPKDIYLLEQQLQIAQDFREDYHWINELRNIRKGKEDERYELTEKELAHNLRRTEKDIQTLLRIMYLVDAFLQWKKIPKQYDYSKLEDTEEIFRQLEKASKKFKNDSGKREALQNAIFNLIEHRPKEGRLYNYVTYLIKHFDQVYNKIDQPNIDDAVNELDSHQVKENENSFLDELDDSTTAIAMFNDPENASETSDQLVETIKDVREENKEKRDAEAVFESISTALRELQGLVIDNETTKLASIKKKLEQIILNSNRLLVQVKSFDDNA